MQYDLQLTISAAGSRRAALWPKQTLYWSALCRRLQTPVRDVLDMKAYLRKPKAEQDDLKDVGGFVGGTLVDDRRRAGAVVTRQLVTLDFDSLPAMATDDALRRLDALGCAYGVYSTRKHRVDAPRLRVLVPLARAVPADEYEPIARRLAGYIGIEWCDPTTFEASRLMYWPSVCAGSPYVCAFGDKPFADPGGLLHTYDDWRDIAGWPQVPGTLQKERGLSERQEDPTAKRGIVGAFCRVYDVPGAMDTFLPGAYEPAGDGRYTFTGGSTTGGAVLYGDGKWLYSHHATDPTSGRLVNAYDLVRLHRFSELDDDAKPDTPPNRLPSYAAMKLLAEADAPVRLLREREKQDAVREDFRELTGDVADNEDLNWTLALEDGIGGQRAKTMENGLLVLRNDPLLRGGIAFDQFAGRLMARGGLPWDRSPDARQWTDTDDHGAEHYLEKAWQLNLPEHKMIGVIDLFSKEHRYNDVAEYLDGLVWDGTARLDTLLIDYLGAEDTPYTRAVTRKALVAAVARVYTPGVKFDWVLTLVGGQGVGKSTFFRILGGRWFCDSLTTFDGKDPCEVIQGKWLVELGELSALTKSEMSTVKQFLSRQDDTYRAAYGRRSETYPRRCVFFGTTNEQEFLRDATGDRRWWPVEVRTTVPRACVFTELAPVRDQVWAEAVACWQLGEPLHLVDAALEEAARKAQDTHKEFNAWDGLIRAFLETPMPADWRKLDLGARRMWLSGMAVKEGVETVLRDQVCALDVWCECFGNDKGRMLQRDTRAINTLLSRIEGLEPRAGLNTLYGRQRGFAWTYERRERRGKGVTEAM
ncbi:MAG: virulence-associated E family protein [Clostridia bacterium]